MSPEPGQELGQGMEAEEGKWVLMLVENWKQQGGHHFQMGKLFQACRKSSFCYLLAVTLALKMFISKSMKNDILFRTCGVGLMQERVRARRHRNIQR